MKPLLLIALSTLALSPSYAAPLRTDSNIVSFTFFETTTVVGQYTFNTNSTELSNQRAGFLGVSNRDFQTGAFEFFDVYYSTAAGLADIDGEYLTIDCSYDGNGSGCNLADVRMNLSNSTSRFADTLTRFVSTTGYVNGSELNAVDGNTATAASLGSAEGVRMSFTVGFSEQNNSAVPEPSTYALTAMGLLAAYLRRKGSR
ncbi:MAG: PEP-CTERM sorting domain-containing protein [Acidobacteria bacterium]|nr:PEP-CTERM sorting domain-containing protein [Acidobacteriota bacterium]